MQTSDSQRKLITEQILRRKDPHIIETIHSCDHVVLYKYVNDTWESTDTEGALHIVKRDKLPYFQLIILNRKNTQNFFFDFSPNHVQIQNQIPYVLFRHTQSSDIFGLWFYNKVHALTFLEANYKLTSSNVNSQQGQQMPQQLQQSLQFPPQLSQQIPHQFFPFEIPPMQLMQPSLSNQQQEGMDFFSNLLKSSLNIQPQQMEFAHPSNSSQPSVSTNPQSQQDTQSAFRDVNNVKTTIDKSNENTLSISKEVRNYDKNNGKESSTTGTQKNRKESMAHDKSKRTRLESKSEVHTKVEKKQERKSNRDKTTGKEEMKKNEEQKKISGPSKIIKRNQELPQTSKSTPEVRNRNQALQKLEKPETKPKSVDKDPLTLLPPHFVTSELNNLHPENGGNTLESIETKEEFKSFLLDLISNEKDTRFFDNLYRHFMLTRKFGDKI